MLRSFRITFDSMLASKERFTEAEIYRFAHMCYGEHITPDRTQSIRRADGRLRKVMFGSMMSGRCADEKKLVETSPLPVAMVNGSNDPFFGLGYVAGIRYANLWDGMCHVIPDAGHAAFAEEAGRVQSAVDALRRRCRRRPHRAPPGGKGPMSA